MKQDNKIFVAGHRGMVGSAVVRELQSRGFYNLITRTHSQLDLTRQTDVESFFSEESPDVVVMAAARVGGIIANYSTPAEFIRENLAMQINVLHSAYLHGTKRLLFLASSCIYPREAPQPITEDSLLTGPLEVTNEAYAVAKIAGVEMCKHYRSQYGVTFHSIMPSNLYGLGDNYHPENSHVIPGLMRRLHEAKMNSDMEVTVWGTGEPRREFLHTDDLAVSIFMLLQDENPPNIANVGAGEDLRIADLAPLIAETVGYKGRIKFDPSRPDGTPRKLMDNSYILSIGWRPSVTLREGLVGVYKDFLSSYGN